MIAYVPCSSCQTFRIAVSTDTPAQEQPVCLICQLRQTQNGLDRELQATWEALRPPA